MTLGARGSGLGAGGSGLGARGWELVTARLESGHQGHDAGRSICLRLAELGERRAQNENPEPNIEPNLEPNPENEPRTEHEPRTTNPEPRTTGIAFVLAFA